jgi:hypothetical protein
LAAAVVAADVEEVAAVAMLLLATSVEWAVAVVVLVASVAVAGEVLLRAVTVVVMAHLLVATLPLQLPMAVAAAVAVTVEATAIHPVLAATLGGRSIALPRRRHRRSSTGRSRTSWTTMTAAFPFLRFSYLRFITFFRGTKEIPESHTPTSI